MGARIATAPWSVGVSLTRQPAFSHSLGATSSSSHASVRCLLSLPRLVAAAAAASQATVADTPPPPPTPSPPAPSPPPPPLGDEEGGPIQLPDSEGPFAIPSSGISPLQSAASILLTGTIGVLLYRSLRRRIKLAKETKVRSTGLENVNEALKKPPILNQKAETTTVKAPPNAWQTFQGAVIAGVIGLFLYNFATYVDAGFASKPVSNVYTIRQLTITVRTIVNGLCYLAAFVFAANSIGLTAYTLQLLLKLIPTENTQNGDDKKPTDQGPLQMDTLEEVKED